MVAPFFLHLQQTRVDILLPFSSRFSETGGMEKINHYALEQQKVVFSLHRESKSDTSCHYMLGAELARCNAKWNRCPFQRYGITILKRNEMVLRLMCGPKIVIFDD
jgi:hypothetical protein